MVFYARIMPCGPLLPRCHHCSDGVRGWHVQFAYGTERRGGVPGLQRGLLVRCRLPQRHAECVPTRDFWGLYGARHCRLLGPVLCGLLRELRGADGGPLQRSVLLRQMGRRGRHCCSLQRRVQRGQVRPSRQHSHRCDVRRRLQRWLLLPRWLLLCHCYHMPNRQLLPRRQWRAHHLPLRRLRHHWPCRAAHLLALCQRAA